MYLFSGLHLYTQGENAAKSRKATPRESQGLPAIEATPQSVILKRLYLMMLLKCTFFRASFIHPIKDTDGMQLRLLKVETLLNNAEKD